MRTFAWLALTASIVPCAHAVLAQDKHPAAVLFSTSGAPKGSPLDSVLQSALDDLDVVEVVARPGMDLGAVQLALDCVSETAQCLRAAADQSGAQVVIAPTLQHTGNELVLSVLRFDSRGGSMRRVARRQAGQVVSSQLLDEVPNLLRELFDLPPLKKEQAPPPSAATPPDTTPDLEVNRLPEAPMEPPTWRVPVAPFILAGVGVLVVGGGIVSGVLMKNKQNQYNRLSIDTTKDAQLASDTRSTAKTEAVLADVMFGVGAAAIVTAGIWLLVDHSVAMNRDSYQTSLDPMFGPRQFGLVFTHRGSAL